jgi:hypothetical protein
MALPFLEMERPQQEMALSFLEIEPPEQEMKPSKT